jgi:hypothetical protein
MKMPRTARFGGVAFLVLATLATLACAAEPDADERAAFQADLAVEQVDGVVHAYGEHVLLDLTKSPEEIAAAAESVRQLFEERDPEAGLTLLLYRQGVFDSRTEFSIDTVSEQVEKFEERVALWAGLVTRGFASVGMTLYSAGSQYGEGGISVSGWFGPGEQPSAGETYFEIVDGIAAVGLTPALMQVNVELGIDILCDDVSVPVAPRLFDTYERVVTQLNAAFDQIQIKPEGAVINIGHGPSDQGERVPLTDAEAAAVLAEFDAAGLLTDSLSIVDVGRVETGDARLWGPAQ